MNDQDIISRETNEAIERGFDGSGLEWRKMVFACLWKICKTHHSFTVNDFRNFVDASPIKTHDKRAMGGVMKKAQTLGWIAPSGTSIRSRVGHGVRMQVWLSLLYKSNYEIK